MSIWIRSTGLAQGFDAYAYQGQLDAFHEGTLGQKIDLAIQYLSQNRERPFFLFLHTYEVHGPYRRRRLDAEEPRDVQLSTSDREINLYPKQASTDLVSAYEPRWQESRVFGSVPLLEEEFGRVAEYYDSGIRFTDRQLARLFEYLRVSGLEEETIVVLTSDHGEALGEGGRFGHAYLSDDNLLVPLVIAFPSRLQVGQRIPAQVRSVDIFPTILDLAQVDAVTGIDGATLTPLLDGHTSVGRDAWSYAPNSNVGVSIRTSDGLQYIFNNTAFSSTAGQERLRVWRDDQQDLRNVSTRRERARALGTLVRHRLEQRPGLRVRLLNGGSFPLEGVLRSPAIRQTTVKASEELCGGCIAWVGSGQVDVVVPAGTTYTVVLEDVGDQPGRITGHLTLNEAKHPPGSLDIDLAPSQRGPLLLKLSGQEWIEVSRESEISIGLKIWRKGDSSPHRMTPPEARSHDLLRQLHTLGYVR